MRSQISHQTHTPEQQSEKQGEIVLKLLNQVAVDLGPIFLQQGIVIKGQDFRRFLDYLPDDFSAERFQMEMDGEKINFDDFGHMEWMAKDVLLRVNPVNEV